MTVKVLKTPKSGNATLKAVAFFLPCDWGKIVIACRVWAKYKTEREIARSSLCCFQRPAISIGGIAKTGPEKAKESYVMSDLIPSPTVSLVDGKPMVNSREVALRFQRKHKNVLQEIERIRSMCPQSFTGLNFQPSEYTDATGRSLPCYLLTRDAFSLLAMGFTGKAAILWKLQYIEAFNTLEQAALEGMRGQIALARSEGAAAALALSPLEKARVSKALGYRKRGFSYQETAKGMGVHKRKVSHLLKTARELGLGA